MDPGCALSLAQRVGVAQAAEVLLELLGEPEELPRGVVVAWAVELLLLVDPPAAAALTLKED